MTAAEIIAKSQQIHRRLGAGLATWLKAAKRQHSGKITCRKGCDHCCRLMVMSFTFEGVLIANRLLRTGASGINVIKKFQDDGQAQRSLIQEYTSAGVREQHDLAAKAWFRKGEPCPLLVGSLCSAYDIRPLSCASHYVVTPPCQCGPPDGQDIGTINATPLFARAMNYNAELVSAIWEKPDWSTWPEPLGSAVVGGYILLAKGVEEYRSVMLIESAEPTPASVEQD